MTQRLASAPWFRIPRFGVIGLAFSPSLLLPLLVGGVAVTLSTIACVTAAQKMNDADWRRQDLPSLSGGVLADGLGAILAALLGGVGQSASEIIASRLLDARKTFTLGIAFAAAVASHSVVAAAHGIPEWLAPITESPLFLGVAVALVLNPILRIGIARRERLTLSGAALAHEVIDRFVNECGARWGRGATSSSGLAMSSRR